MLIRTKRIHYLIEGSISLCRKYVKSEYKPLDGVKLSNVWFTEIAKDVTCKHCLKVMNQDREAYGLKGIDGYKFTGSFTPPCEECGGQCCVQSGRYYDVDHAVDLYWWEEKLFKSVAVKYDLRGETKYAIPYENGHCIFFEDGKCSIYDRRPVRCQDFNCLRQLDYPNNKSFFKDYPEVRKMLRRVLPKLFDTSDRS